MSVRPAQRVKNRFVGSPPFALRRDDRDAVAQSYPSLASRLHKPRAARPNKRLFQLYARPPHMSRGSVRSGCRRGPAFHPSAHPVLAAPYRTNVCSNYTPGHPTCQGAESRHLKSYGGEHHQAICDLTRKGGRQMAGERLSKAPWAHRRRYAEARPGGENNLEACVSGQFRGQWCAIRPGFIGFPSVF